MEKYIPEGYKQTGIGEIPEDWVYKKISELTNIFGRIGFRGYTKRDIVEVGKGAISISPSNILDTRINYEKCTFISWYKYEESPEIQIVNNDVILVKTGSTFGKAALIHNLPNKATINPQLVVFKDIRIPNIYLSYLINSKIVQNQIQKNVVGGAIPTLSQAMVKNFVVPIPHSRREQESIARALSDVDNLITSLEQLIEKKKAIKQGTMQELLTGRRRLKGFGDGKGYKQTELGMIPEDWILIPLFELTDRKKPHSFTGGPFGSNLKAQDYCAEGIRILQLQNIGDGKFLDDYKIYTSEQKANELFVNNIFPNEIIIAKMGNPVARACLIPPNNSRRYVMASDGIRCAIDEKKYSTQFVLYQINYKNFRNIAELASSGTTRLRISLSELKKIPVMIPQLKEQIAIAKVLSEMESEIEKLDTKVDKYKQIKQGMMQNLLTGRIRLV